MAPNLHESSSFHSLCSLDLSNHLLTSKFSPLVPPPSVVIGETANSISTIPALLAPRKPQAKAQAPAPSKKDSECDSYWFMPADEEVDYFSSSYMEKSLAKDAQRRETESEKIEANYAPDSAVTSYWDWAENDTQENKSTLKQALIQTILKEESIRQMLCAENIASKESEYHQTRGNVVQVNASDETNQEHSSHEYFYFPQPAESKKDIIERILREEELRRTVLTENIVMNLIRNSEEQKEEEPVSRTRTVGSQQSYWDW